MFYSHRESVSVMERDTKAGRLFTEVMETERVIWNDSEIYKNTNKGDQDVKAPCIQQWRDVDNSVNTNQPAVYWLVHSWLALIEKFGDTFKKKRRRRWWRSVVCEAWELVLGGQSFPLSWCFPADKGFGWSREAERSALWMSNLQL